MLPSWDRALHALILIRMGQELGSDSRLARAVHALVDMFVTIFK